MSDPALESTVQRLLVARNYHSTWCRTESEIARNLGAVDFSLAIIDLEIASGVDTVAMVRRANEAMGVLLLAPEYDDSLLHSALLDGADDFVIKPVSPRELAIRLDLVEVRAELRPKSSLESRDMRVDLIARKAYRGGRLLPLTPTEFRILEILMQHENRVVTRQKLCEALWSPDWEGMTNVIEVHINRLRNKIGREDAHRVIRTVRGKGYRFQGQAAAKEADTSDDVSKDARTACGRGELKPVH